MMLTCREGVQKEATSETNTPKVMMCGYRKERRRAVGRRGKKKKLQRENEKRVLIWSALVIAACSGCQRTWLNPDLCQQHEEVVRQTHNKTCCSWVLRNRGWGERSECSLWARLCVWHLRPPPHKLTQVVHRRPGRMFVCRPKPHISSVSKSEKEWPHSLSENRALVRKTASPIPLIQPLSADHVGEVRMDKPGCCSIALGQFHAHKRSQGSVKAHSSLNSRPSNPFMLLYSLSCSVCVCVCVCFILTHTVSSLEGACQMSVLRLGAIKPVVMMKEFICHLFPQLKSNWVIEILIRLALVFHLHCFWASLSPHLCSNSHCWRYTSVFSDFCAEQESS